MTRAIRRHVTSILIVLALTSLLLGSAGFRACDASTTWPTALYRSVQLFIWGYFPWNTTAEAVLPWTLELARWLAPLTTLGAMWRVAMGLFHRHWDGFRARRQRGHVIVCGAGMKGAALVGDLHRRGLGPAVVVERDESVAEALSAQGVLVVHGDARTTEVLRRVALPHAATLVLTTGDDHDNLTIAMAAEHLTERDRALTIHTHSGSASLGDLYHRNHALAASVGGAVSVRMFNHFRNVARCTIRDFPPESATAEAHVILPDLSSVGGALAVEYALLGHFTGERRMHLHIVSATASQDLAMLRSHYPGIDQCATLEALDLATAEMFSRRAAALVTDATFTIFPGFTNEQEAFARALELLEFARSRTAVRVLLPGAPDSPIRALVERNATLRGRLGFLPSPEKTCGYEAIIGGSLDRTARAIHENWLKETQRQIEAARAAGDETLARRHESKATFKPWDELSEEQKGASRSQADHMPFKIRAVGFDPNGVTAADWAKLSPAQIETLARMEHARWAAYYWMTGWTCAAQRDDERKHHPDLIPYDQLDEPTKEYDRAAVRNLAQHLRT